MPAGSQSPHSTMTVWLLLSAMSLDRHRLAGDESRPRHAGDQRAVGANDVDAVVGEFRRACDLNGGRSEDVAHPRRGVVHHVDVDAGRHHAARIAGVTEGGIGQREGEPAVADAVEVDVTRLDTNARDGPAESRLDHFDAEVAREDIPPSEGKGVELGHSAAFRNGIDTDSMDARVFDSDSPSGSASAATRALATASAAALGDMRPASAGAITSSAMRR